MKGHASSLQITIINSNCFQKTHIVSSTCQSSPIQSSPYQSIDSPIRPLSCQPLKCPSQPNHLLDQLVDDSIDFLVICFVSKPID